MLKEKEKRIFWIVVMAIAVVSLISACVSSIIVSMDDLINYGDAIGEWDDCDYAFSAAVLLLAFVVMVAAAVAHLATKGKNCVKAKIIWAAVIGGYFLLSCIVLTIVHYVVVVDYNSYKSLVAFATTGVSITVSYEIAFLAQMILSKNKNQDAAENSDASEGTQE